MNEAIGKTFLVNFIIIFTVIFIGLFGGSLTYTKAMKVKNRIINMIEQNGGYDSALESEINNYLREVGYKISSRTPNCTINGLGTNDFRVLNNRANSYRYCIFEFTKAGSGNRPTTKYYGVKTYMYMDLPIIGHFFEIPVYGETKQIGLFN